MSLWLLQARGQGSHDGRRRQRNWYMVVFTCGTWALSLRSIAAYSHTLVHHFHPVSLKRNYHLCRCSVYKVFCNPNNESHKQSQVLAEKKVHEQTSTSSKEDQWRLQKKIILRTSYFVQSFLFITLKPPRLDHT